MAAATDGTGAGQNTEGAGAGGGGLPGKGAWRAPLGPKQSAGRKPRAESPHCAGSAHGLTAHAQGAGQVPGVSVLLWLAALADCVGSEEEKEVWKWGAQDCQLCAAQTAFYPLSFTL